MLNFGRGMWRRIGDYNREQTLKNIKLQHYLALVEYQKKKHMQSINKYNQRQIIKEVNNSIDNEVIIEQDIDTLIEEPVIEEHVIEEHVIEEPVIVPIQKIASPTVNIQKKGRKKNKK